MKNKLFLVVVMFVLLISGFWLFGHSYLQIAVNNPTVGDVFEYKITDQSTNTTTSIKSRSSSIKKLVRKSSYLVLTTGGNSSAVSIVSTRSMLRTATVKQDIAPERQRSFIGNNPAPCMNYIGSILYSYECGGLFSSVAMHVPSSSNTPTYANTKLFSSVVGFVEGIIQTKGGVVALVKDGSGHNLFASRTGLQDLVNIGRASLSNSSYYSIKASGYGFVVYDSLFKSVLSYPDIGSQPQTIAINKPKGNLNPVSLDSYGDSIAVLFSASEPNSEAVQLNKSNSVIAIQNKKSVKYFNFNQDISSYSLCGSFKLCVLMGDQLNIFDVSGKSLKIAYVIGGVSAAYRFNDRFLVLRGGQVINFDVETRSGSVDYSLGNYGFCGIGIDPLGYELCLIDSKNNKSALRIYHQPDTGGAVDKKIYDLGKLGEVKFLSAYGSYIFVSPEVGQLEYNADLKVFDYNSSLKKSVNQKINQAVDSLKIDRTKYTIVNTLP